jgi:hypothetical protein
MGDAPQTASDQGMVMNTNTKAKVELELRPMEDHELEIVRGGFELLNFEVSAESQSSELRRWGAPGGCL